MTKTKAKPKTKPKKTPLKAWSAIARHSDPEEQAARVLLQLAPKLKVKPAVIARDIVRVKATNSSLVIAFATGELHCTRCERELPALIPASTKIAFRALGAISYAGSYLEVELDCEKIDPADGWNFGDAKLDPEKQDIFSLVRADADLYYLHPKRKTLCFLDHETGDFSELKGVC
jgi:hypothetical protein